MFNISKRSPNIPALLIILLSATLASAGCKKQTVVEADFAALKIVGFVYEGAIVVANLSGRELPVYKEARNITGGIMSPDFYNNYIHQSPQPLWLHAFPGCQPGQRSSP